MQEALPAACETDPSSSSRAEVGNWGFSCVAAAADSTHITVQHAHKLSLTALLAAVVNFL